MSRTFIRTTACISIMLVFAAVGHAEHFSREFNFERGGVIEIVNRFGKVTVSTSKPTAAGSENSASSKVTFTADGNVYEREIKFDASARRIVVNVEPSTTSKRVDLTVELPERSKLKVETRDGEIVAAGNLSSIEAVTETGTIAVDVPTDDLKYDLLWTSSRPRILSDIELEKIKEKSGGKFGIKGKFTAEPGAKAKHSNDLPDGVDPEVIAATPGSDAESGKKNRPEDKRSKIDDRSVALDVITARGIVLINVPQSEVMSDLRERPLTNAAKAIIRSGDTVLMDAIRRASPKYFGDYSRTLPPIRRAPELAVREKITNTNATQKRVTLRVTDTNNRAIAGLVAADFELTESGDTREITDVQSVTAPFNLVLLLDVSGSVENYVNFIRKAARAFVDTVDSNDRVSIVLFNDDVKVLSGFTTDKAKLSATLDSFDAGGATAYYDAVAYTLADTLRPLKGERTAIVVLTDGDDNRSFLPFESLLGAIEESGALIYPLYVPSALIAAAETDNLADIDPLRYRYINTSLTSKAEAEGPLLAKVSGGVYYPITQLSQIQTAYNDIVVQLRTAYSITFRSSDADVGSGVSPRLKVKVKRKDAFVAIGRVESVPQ